MLHDHILQRPPKVALPSFLAIRVRSSAIWRNAVQLYDGDYQTYYDALPATHRRLFDQLGSYWKLAPNNSASDRETTFQLLSACEMLAYDIALMRDHVRTLAQSMVDADFDTLRTLLADFAIQKLGNRLDRVTVVSFLTTKGIALRSSTDIGSLARGMAELQRSFVDSITPYLITDTLIHREEANILVEDVTSTRSDRPRLIMVHGRGGIGKSGVLLELVNVLKERNISYLPIRLDRNMPAQSPDQFGRAVCGLPSSPVTSLEALVGTGRAVLILDQLDALRWTAAHTDKPMDVVTEVIREAFNPLGPLRNITVVLVCRTFDLEEDQRIAHLKTLAKSAVIEIGLLTPQATQKVVDSTGEIWASLSEQQRQLLRQPQTLYLWSRLRIAQNHAPIFRTHTDLMRAFWTDMFSRQKPQSIDAPALRGVLDTLVHAMDQAGRLTAPASRIHYSDSSILGFLRSTGVIRIDGKNQCIFTHQSYFDFLVAEELNRRLLGGKTTLIEWLHGNEQSLFRRDQLRQVLALQRDDDPSAYLMALESLLRDKPDPISHEALGFNASAWSRHASIKSRGGARFYLTQ